MNAETPAPKPQPDLRWTSPYEGMAMGAFTLTAISLIMVVCQLFYAKAQGNPWLLTTPKHGYFLFQESITSIFTTHFFHGSWSHLGSDLLALWACGLIAFAVAGARRALAAIGWGILFAGLAQLLAEQPGSVYLGSGPIIFAFIGLIITAAIRKGTLFIILVIIALSLIGGFVFDKVLPRMAEYDVEISRMGLLGGLIGGIMADLKDPNEAIRLLYKRSLISGKLAEKLLRKWAPDRYEGVSGERPIPAPASVPRPTAQQPAIPIETVVVNTEPSTKPQRESDNQPPAVQS